MSAEPVLRDFSAQVLSGPVPLIGTAGADYLAGTTAAEVVLGLGGDDVLVGNAGGDLVIGGPGFDMISGDAVDPVVAVGRGFTDVFLAEIGSGKLDSGGGYDLPPVTDAQVAWALSPDRGPDADIVLGGGGTDMIDPGAGDDILLGGGGADWILASDGADVVDGGAGTDIYVMTWADDAALAVDLAAATWQGGGTEADSFSGVEGVIGILTAPNDLRGDSGDNPLYGGYRDDVLGGRGGDDLLFGNDGADVIDGGAGEDVLGGDFFIFAFDDYTLFTGWRYSPDFGMDTLTGGPGADTFVLMVDSGNDVITDFDPAEDAIAIAGNDPSAGVEDVLAAARQEGDDVVLTLSSDTQVTLQGVALEDLTADDFVLFDQDTRWISNEYLDGY